MSANAKQVTVDGQAVTIRPIRPTDVKIEVDFIRNLSSEAKHFRFFGALRELSAEEAKHLCEIDGPNSMAYVAVTREAGHDVEIGVCRYAPGEKADSRELAITIADKWQHTALPQLLFDSLVESARKYGVHELFAIELVDNQNMHEFALKNGMTVKHDLDEPTQVTYSLSIR